MKVRHAGERRHPDSFLVQVQKPLAGNRANLSRHVNEQDQLLHRIHYALFKKLNDSGFFDQLVKRQTAAIDLVTSNHIQIVVQFEVS